MKRILSIGLVCMMLTILLTGCGDTLKADCDTVYIQKKGTIIGASVESFDQDYYEEEELKAFIDKEVEDYQKSHEEDSLKVTDFSVKDKQAALFIKYAGYEDYADFNKVTLFAGTIPQALAAGYDFDASFMAIKDGKTGQEVSGQEIMELEDKVVILSEKIDVKVDGKITYVSSANAEIKSEDTVSLKLQEDSTNGEELSLVYVIYE